MELELLMWALAIGRPFLIGMSLTLVLLAVLGIVVLIRSQERSVRQERALREAGLALVTATDRDGIYEAAITAVESLVGAGRSIHVVARREDDHRFSLVAASDGDGSDGNGEALQLPGLETDLATTDGARKGTKLTTELVEVLGLPEDGHTTALPLTLEDDLRGLLVVSSPTEMSETTLEALETLAAQVALALERAALTEDLHRGQSEARFASLVQNSSDVVTVLDADSTLRWVSPSSERVFGYRPEELEGSKLTAIVHPEDKAQVLQFLMVAAPTDNPRPAMTEFRIRHHGDFWLQVESVRTNLLHDPNVRGLVLNTRDVSERKTFEEQLKHHAFHDVVTGLANRALFKDRIEHALARCEREDKPVSVLLMDLDDFKTINDSLGHEAGDLMLAEVGERVKDSLRAADTAARLGGDEFAVLLEDGGEGLGAADVAVRILASLEAPFHLEGKEVFVRASIGIAMADEFADAGGGADELLRNADVAMYMAKESGKNRYQIFQREMHASALARLELKADLQRALDNDEFVLHFQPIIELQTGDVSGVEALLRWNHPRRGIVPPLEFIPLAEESGLIVAIGRWVLREATRQGRVLQEHFPIEPPLHVAVNLSARQLQRPELVSEVAEALVESGFAPGDLVIEITESVMMRDIELSIQRLAELKEIGVRLAVDDFGTGYSSLNYIQRFPVDILKVDKSFVDAFDNDPRKSAVAATIIKLAEDLDLRPVAEGIERADQLERLLRLHCDFGQGFYFAKPLPMQGIEDLLATRRALANRDAELAAEPEAPPA
jgi:diguanylate cyclase (GGDEF)-like protein/PAS domain S-box-containing protein